MDRYIILQPAARSGGMRSSSSMSSGDPQSMLKFAELDRGEASDLARSGAVLAPVMPLSLIAPVPMASVSGANHATAVASAATKQYSGRGVRVAILDTGVDHDHVAFQGVNFSFEDFTGTGYADDNGHGTHCAGTFFGRDVGGIQLSVASGIEDVYSAKVLDSAGRGSIEQLFRALQAAELKEVDIISMSVAFDASAMLDDLVKHGYSQRQAMSHTLVAYRSSLRLFDSFMEALSKRENEIHVPLVVAAAGNESRRSLGLKIEKGLPSAGHNVLSVGAVQAGSNGFTVADFSNANPDVVALGVDVVSARAGTGNDLLAMSGTSMACPLVAGLSALWIEKWRDRKMSTKGARHRIIAGSSLDSCTSVNSEDHGAGIPSPPA